MNNLIKIGLGLAVAIVFPFMVGFGIEAFYTSPKQPYEVCRHLDPNSLTPVREGETALAKEYRDPMLDDTYKQCFDNAQKEVDIFSRNLFLIAAAFGFVAIAVGTLLFSEKIGPVGPGLVFGGLFTIAYGTMRSFRSLDKKWIFLELLVVFVGIIIVTWRYLQVNKPKK